MSSLAEPRPVALVTGAASGIGQAVCQRLRRRGDLVVGLDLRALTETEAAGTGVADSVACDVSDPDAVDDAVDAVRARVGTISCVVHAAGWTPHCKFTELSRKDAEKVVAVNYLGTINLARAVVPAMVASGAGRLLFISSDAARTGVPDEAVYAGAKAAQIAFAKSLAVEVARFGVTVNVVCPGSTDTPLLRSMYDDEQLARRIRANPMKRLGRPEDIAAAVDFLTSSDASYVTGQVLSVNGGMTRVD